MAEAKTTTDHQEIKHWIEKRHGHPAAVRATHSKKDPGILRVDFEPDEEEGLERISWEEFFDKFERENLAFLYQDTVGAGKPSRFFKFIERDRSF